MYVLTHCYSGTPVLVPYSTHLQTDTHRRTIIFFPAMNLCSFEAEDWLNHCVMSYFTSTSTKHHGILSVQFLLRDMKAAFTLSRSVKDGTQTQEINPQWQSAIHHFRHFRCEKKRKGIVFSPLRSTSSLSLLMSSLHVADWLFCGVYRIFFLVQTCKTQTLWQ